MKKKILAIGVILLFIGLMCIPTTSALNPEKNDAEPGTNRAHFYYLFIGKNPRDGEQGRHYDVIFGFHLEFVEGIFGILRFPLIMTVHSRDYTNSIYFAYGNYLSIPIGLDTYLVSGHQNL